MLLRRPHHHLEEANTLTVSSVVLNVKATAQRLSLPLVLYAIACVAITGGLWLAAALVGGRVQESPTMWLFAAGASGPSLAALVALIAFRQGGGILRRRIRAPWLWLPASLVLGALPAVVSALVLDPSMFGSRAPEVVAAMGGPVPFLVVFLIAGPLAEEFGWRGYVQPRLRVRFGVLVTAVILGTAWAIWHLPLFLLEGTTQHAMGLWTPRAMIFLITMLPLSVVYLLVSERLGGGVMAAIVMHFSGNATGALLPQHDDIAALIQLAVVLVLSAGIVVLCRSGRLSRWR